MQKVSAEFIPLLDSTKHNILFARNWLCVTEYKKGLVCLFVSSATDPSIGPWPPRSRGF